MTVQIVNLDAPWVADIEILRRRSYLMVVRLPFNRALLLSRLKL